MRRVWYQSLIGELFAPINQVYENIQKESVGDEGDVVRSSIEHCKKISYRNSKYFKMNYRLNQLANYFDAAMNERRMKRATEKNIHWICSKHAFVISPDISPDESSVFSKKHDKCLPPDERLIYIELDKSENNVLLSILHEMGHFIGVRKRYDRFHTYFQEILVNTLCNQLWIRMCYAYNGYAYSHEHIDFINDTVFPDRSIAFAKVAHMFINNEVKRYIYDTFKVFYSKAVEEIKNSIVDMDGYEKPVEKPEHREVAAIEMCFFESIRPIALHVLYLIFSAEKIKAKVLRVGKDYVDKKIAQEHETELFIKYLSDAWQEMKEHIVDCKDEIKKIPDWYQACEAQFEEPAADVFMLRVTNTPIKEYIMHIVQLYQTRHQRDKEVSLLNLFTNPALNTRVLGVCLAAKANDRDFCCILDFIDSKLPLHCRRRQRYEVRQLLRRRYAKISTAGSDFHLVAEYIATLWNDPLYDSFTASNKGWINELNSRSSFSSLFINRDQILKWCGNESQD